MERAKGRRGGAGDNNYLAHCGGGQRVQGLDTRGRRLEEVAKRDREIVEEARSKVTSAEEIVTKAERNGTIEETSFFIMHANIFVRTPEDGFVVPAEIALTKFSIEEGVAGAPLQFFPDPGKIPSGYKWSCIVPYSQCYFFLQKQLSLFLESMPQLPHTQHHVLVLDMCIAFVCPVGIGLHLSPLSS